MPPIRHLLLVLLAAVVAALAGGCGDAATGTLGVDLAPAPDRGMRPGVRVKVVSSDYGRIVADGRGQAVYFFERERGSTPRCYGACATAWPPVLAKGRPRGGAGADPQLVGVTRRRDGRRQVTYAGHPVYYYVGDSPGRVLCHDVTEFGGRWVVIRPDGTPAP